MKVSLGFAENFGTSLFDKRACRDALADGEKALVEGAHPTYLIVIRKFGLGVPKLSSVGSKGPSKRTLDAREERVFGEVLTCGSMPRRLLLWERLSRRV